LKEFYDTFYHPNNATAMLIGDFVAAGMYEPCSGEELPMVWMTSEGRLRAGR
jgi:hypothetical protein